MSDRTGKPDGLDAALAAWPAVAGSERSAVEWDEVAEKVVARAEEAVSGRIFGAPPVSEEDLLRSPLPQSPEEVQSSAPVGRSEGPGMTTTSRERDRATLKDLARMAQMTAPSSGRISAPPASGTQPAGEATKEDSGLINLAAIAAADAPPAPGQAKPVVRLPEGATPEMMSTLRSATERPKPEPGAPAAAGTKKRTPWVAVSGVVAAAAVAAGAFFGMQHAQRSAPSAVAAVPVAQPAAPAATAPAAASLATPIPPGDLGVDPSTLPAAGSLAAHGPVPSVAKPAGASAQATAPTTAAPAAPTTPPALVAAIPTAAPAASGSAQSLQALMQQAAGVTSSPAAAPTTTADAPEAPAPGSVPLKPSQGAISGALGAALPGARGCLGPDDPISHATVTFRSDGSVQSVGVSGGAAGKPAEACIRAALSKARVAPFAQPTFTASTTVRPN